MRELPSFQTSLVPMGTYVAEVKGEIQEKVSTFDNSRSYLELLLMLKSDRGEFFSFSWCFTVRSPKLADFLLAIGVRRLPSGNVHPPPQGTLHRPESLRLDRTAEREGRERREARQRDSLSL